MADENIKKLIIPNNALPLVSYDDDELYYDIRYRIISEDKNRTSHWSELTRIVMPTTTEADLPYTTSPRVTVYSANTDSGGKSITATWTYPKEAGEFNIDPYKAELERRFSQVSFFDIYVRWSPDTSGSTWDDWKYETTTYSNSFSIIRKESPYTAKRVEVAMQIPTAIKSIDTRLQLFKALHAV